MSRRIGQYEIERELGQGLGQIGMNTVYLGRDPRLDREVVIKTAMAKQAGERYESGTALMVAIQEVITQTEMINADASKDEKALTTVSEGFNSANIDGRPLPFSSIAMGNDLVEVEPEAAPEGKEQLHKRLITGCVVLLVAVLIFFAFLLRDLSQIVTNGNGNGEVASSITVKGTLKEGERPLADLETAERANFYDTYPEIVIDQSKSYEAVIRTEKGDMIIQLFDNESPLAVNSFVFLATQGFYDGTVFHRVLADFMAQGGDPTGSGAGGPGYVFDDEVENELIFDRPHLLAMANAGANTNGSQFFITFVETPHLDGGYTIFGELIDGEDVLNSIAFIDPVNPVPGAVGDEILRIDIYES
jgi:cyclophilin family peptidyl-prolyl cis-trans isomerase